MIGVIPDAATPPGHPEPGPGWQDSLWARVRSAARAVLLLDYDGTLAPLTIDRAQAWPYPGVPEALERLAAQARTRLVIVSGRSVAELLRLLPQAAALEVWGSHGFEQRLPSGLVVHPALNPAQQSILRSAADRATAAGYGAQLEFKPGCLALHWRGLPAERTALLREQLEPQWATLSGEGIELHIFDGGLELRSCMASKARPVLAVRAEEGAETPLVYLGDDLTDEDAFAALPPGGMGILVRPAWRPTAATAWLRTAEEVLEFLATWLESRAALSGSAR